MPDILIIGTSEKEVSSFTSTAKSEGFRVKLTSDVSAASTLILSRPFDLVLVADSFGEKAVEDISNALWTCNNNGQCVVYCLDIVDSIDVSKKRWSLGILGVELFAGRDVNDQVIDLIKKISQRKQRSGARFRVLVVEDLPSPRDIICSFIEHIEYAFVKGVPSGKEALLELTNNPAEYSCVITDVSMPGMTGFELTEAIRADEKLKHLPVIVLTAYGTPDILMKCLKAGASGFLVKPPSKAHLSRELSRAKRIIFNSSDPRLIQTADIEVVQELLEDKGYL
ncbi:MAG: response regulator [bacterium]|nr:response regulator [bacterium]